MSIDLSHDLHPHSLVKLSPARSCKKSIGNGHRADREETTSLIFISLCDFECIQETTLVQLSSH